MGATLCCFQTDSSEGALTKPRTLSLESTQSEDVLPALVPRKESSTRKISHITCVQTTTYHTGFSSVQPASRSGSTTFSNRPCSLGTILEEPAVAKGVRPTLRDRTSSSDSSFLIGNYGSMKSYRRFAARK